MADVPETAQARPHITAVQWVICVVAAIGFAFDIYALLVLPLIVRPALLELGKFRPGTPDFNHWVGICPARARRSEEHTSELQSHLNLVCRLLLEKKKEILTSPANSY